MNHEILLKLEHGIRDVLNWLQSYLSNRKQYVSINGKSFEQLEIVVFPYMFLLNDLPNIRYVLDFYLFADDTNIYYETTRKISKRQLIKNYMKFIYG